ncbi:LOW QUALITY PROTEIN: vomeronasal type-2 receptor 116-like [Dugong dugon]
MTKKSKSVAIIAGSESVFSAEIGTLLELYKTPQVIYGPFDPILTDRDQFSSLYQMAYKDNSSRVHGVIWLLLHFGWIWAGLFVSEDTKGQQFHRDLKAEMTPSLCVVRAVVQDSGKFQRKEGQSAALLVLFFQSKRFQVGHDGSALACTALCFSVVTAVVLWVFEKHRDTPIVKANNRALSYILLLSLFLRFFCSLLFIGPNSHCILRQITFALVFTVAVCTVLAKTVTVLLAFKAMKLRTVRQLLFSRASNSVIPICPLIQVIICGIWLGTSPPFIDIDTHSEPRNLITESNKGSVTAFYCVLGYLGSLALGTFSLAYLAGNLPDTFKEAKFLTFNMLVFCSVWVTFLLVYHSTKGKAMVALEIFTVLTSSAGLLCCIFARKWYIILSF